MPLHGRLGPVLETEKQMGDLLPATVLSEPRWAIAFPGRARGDRVLVGLLMKHKPTGQRILPLDLVAPSRPTHSSAKRSRA